MSHPAHSGKATSCKWFNLLSRKAAGVNAVELKDLLALIQADSGFAATQRRDGIPLLAAPFVQVVAGQLRAKRNMRNSAHALVSRLIEAGLDPLENAHLFAAHPNPFWVPQVDGRINPAMASPLAMAHVAGDAASLKVMLRHAMRLHGVLPRLAFANARRDTWLHEAATRWDHNAAAACEALVQAGSSPWEPNARGRTPLDQAFSVRAMDRMLLASDVQPSPAARLAARMHLVQHRDFTHLSSKAAERLECDVATDALRTALDTGIPPPTDDGRQEFPLPGFPRALSLREVALVGRLLDPAKPTRREAYHPGALAARAERSRTRKSAIPRTRPTWDIALDDLSNALGGGVGARANILRALIECLLYYRKVPLRVAASLADGADAATEVLELLVVVIEAADGIICTEMEAHTDIIMTCIEGIADSLCRHAPLPPVASDRTNALLLLSVLPATANVDVAYPHQAVVDWLLESMAGWTSEELRAMPLPDLPPSATIDTGFPPASQLSSAVLFRCCPPSMADYLSRLRARTPSMFIRAHAVLSSIAERRNILLNRNALVAATQPGGSRRRA